MARIGTVGYLNARPLHERIDVDQHTLVMAHPAEVARMLRQREVEVALVPVAAVLAADNYRVVPGVCIGADGPVASVLLAAETPPEQWTRVVLDGVSRTSVVLARLLLRHGPLAARVRPDLEIVDVPPSQAAELARGTVAGLVIGDAARALPERLTVRVDLAETWQAWTGLPFVFAVWAGRPELDPAVVAHLQAVGHAGIAGIAGAYTGADLFYLTENLRYHLDDKALMGLRRFAALARRHGLLPTEDFELYGPGVRARPRVAVDALLDRAVDGVALEAEQGLALWHDAPLAELGLAADLRRRALHPGDDVPWMLEARLAADVEPDELAAAVEAGAGRVRLLGAPTPARVAAVAARWPDLELTCETVQGPVAELAAAGLTEVDDTQVDPRDAIAAGLRVVGTLVVGQGESAADRIERLLALRALHAETGGLAAVRCWAAMGDGAAGEAANTAQDHLRATALTRLLLPDVPSVRGAPVTEGLGMAQASLRFGVDHYGVVPLVGAPDRWAHHVAAVVHHLREAGFEPVLQRPPRPTAPAAAPDRPAAR